MAPVASDFNADGFADLAIGRPFEDVGRVTEAGAVSVLYGTGAGLQASAPDDQLWTQDSPDVEDQAEPGDRFGWALAVGDFNGDGFDDLAVGVPTEGLAAAVKAGAVNVLYGSPGGLQATSPADQLWTQDSPNVEDSPEGSDRFGRSLTTEDFNRDGFADLAVGTPFEAVQTLQNAGAVNVLYGSAGGLHAAAPADQFWTQDSDEIEDLSEPQDRLAWSLAAGDFNGDGFGDLAVGVSAEALGAIERAGAVNVLYGSAGGLQATAPADQFWTQDSAGVNAEVQMSDRLGWFLGVGDFNGDGFDDLAAGVPFEDVVGIEGAGAVNVLYGSAVGLQASAPDDQFWAQDTPDVNEEGEAQDWFGWSLAAGDFNGDGFADLAIGVRLEDVGTVADAGAVNVLYGSAGGLQASAPADQLWSEDSPGVTGDPQADDEFGWALGARDLNGDGFADLAIGVPLQDFDAVAGAGATEVLYGTGGGLQASAPDDQQWTEDSLGVKDRVEEDDRFGFTFLVGGQCVPPCHSPVLE